MITLFHAIQSLVPGAEVSVGIFDQEIVWHKPDTAPGDAGPDITRKTAFTTGLRLG